MEVILKAVNPDVALVDKLELPQNVNSGFSFQPRRVVTCILLVFDNRLRCINIFWMLVCQF